MKSNLSPSIFAEILRACASLPNVKFEVLRNHDNNRWWPLYVSDWRLRMIIAGISTRISYSMITTYQSVVSKINQIGYENISSFSESQLLDVIKPLGLGSSRIRFCKSIVNFMDSLEESGKCLYSFSNDELINLIAQNVNGAGFKVAQCCVLYAKGYHCGIVPVDSGMRDKLSLCIGINVEKTPNGHDQMRKHLEVLISQNDCYAIAQKTGYGQLKFPSNRHLTWWVHLVLIYYKRLYCNYPLPTKCPIRTYPNLKIKNICSLHKP